MMMGNKESRESWLGCGSTLLVRAQDIIAGFEGTEKEPREWVVLVVPFALFALVPLIVMAVR